MSSVTSSHCIHSINVMLYGRIQRIHEMMLPKVTSASQDHIIHKYKNVKGKLLKYNYTIRSRVQKFPARHTKAAPNGKCCEGYIVPSMVRLMYQLKSVLK